MWAAPSSDSTYPPGFWGLNAIQGYEIPFLATHSLRKEALLADLNGPMGHSSILLTLTNQSAWKLEGRCHDKLIQSSSSGNLSLTCPSGKGALFVEIEKNGSFD